MAATTSEELTLPLEDDPKCAECSQSIEEGSVLAFGNHIWHVDCFRCCKCSKVIDHDSNLLLLNDGMPICENCSYECSVCQKKIDDLAIMTGDESYHSECFRCRMCQRKIEDLVFAKTSQGIYCIACHNGRMAKNRKNKSTRSSRDLKDKTLPSVPPAQNEGTDLSTARQGTDQSQTFLNTQSYASLADPLPSPSRRPPAPPASISNRDLRPKTGNFSDFDFDLHKSSFKDSGSIDSIPMIFRDEQTVSMPVEHSSQKALDTNPVVSETTLESLPPKSSVRERRRPTDDELRLTAAPLRTDETHLSVARDRTEKGNTSATYSLFPPRSADMHRSPSAGTTPTLSLNDSTLKEARGAENGSWTAMNNSDAGSLLTTRSDERASFQGQKMQEEITGPNVINQAKTLAPAANIDSNASSQSKGTTLQNEQPYAAMSLIDEALSPRRDGRPEIGTPKGFRHLSSKSLEGSPAYKLITDSPVTTFESDVTKAFNLSPQAKRNSQHSLNGGLERSGTISRLAGKMLKHKKSVSGSALTPKSPAQDRRRSTTELADVAAMQAELKVKTERIRYLEQTLAKAVDAQMVEQDLEARKSLLAKVENQLVQSGAEHQSYLHHRHRLSDLSVPLGEWKAKVVADMDSTLKKTRDNLSEEIELLLRERSDLKRENDRLLGKKEELSQEVEVLDLRRANLVEMHESMLKQIQTKMEANKDARGATHARLDQAQTHSPRRSPSFSFSEADSRGPTTTTNSEHDLALPPNASSMREALIEEEDEPMLESAVKRMSGERPADMVAPKKFNLVKKTKKAFRWGRAPSSSDGLLPPSTTNGMGNLSLTERTMSSSRSSDKLSVKSNSNNMFKRTWQSQQNLSSYLEPRLDDTPVVCTTLFGQDLTKQAHSEGRLVPHIVTSCIKVIETRALEFEGLYRKSGGAGEMKSLIEAFEIANSEGETINIPGFLDISAITSVLKQYLRKLPIPLVTFETYTPFINTAAIPNQTIRIRAIQEVLGDLPECHRETLRVMFKHLNLVSLHSGTNLMTTKNLAVVLGPSIIWDQAGEKEILDMHEKNSCIQFCIEHANQL